ncbi:MAG: collagen-like protein [Ruminiclostridium sp.]|nr:collagen-like protein [Ruminiclostridium sp.]
MKLRKLTGVMLAAALIASYGSTVTASAETGLWGSSVVEKSIGYSSLDFLFEGNGGSLANWLDNNSSKRTVTFRATAPRDATDLYLTYANMQTILEYSENMSVYFEITMYEENTGLPYTVFFDTSDLVGAPVYLTSKESVNLSLSFETDSTNKKLTIYGKNIKNVFNKLPLNLDYTIKNESFDELLNLSGLFTYYKNELILCNMSGTTLMEDIKSGEYLNFYINNTNRTGVYITNKGDEETYEGDAAKQLVEDYLYKYIGLSESEVKSDYRTTYSFVKEAVGEIVDNLPQYSTKQEIKEAVNYYLLDNKSELIECIVSDVDFSLEDEILDILGDDATIENQNDLKSYIEEMIADQLEAYQLSADDIISALQKDPAVYDRLIDDIIDEIGDSLKGEDGANGLSAYELAVQNGYKGTLTQWLDSLKGQDGATGPAGADGAPGATGPAGADGTNGKDGESFEDWAKRNYGSVENFISSISFEGWAKKNYGSVDNFLKVATGTSGLSAYDLAKQQGYTGTLAQWLESLRGEDGLSAYELAKQQGYRGTLDEWLDSLHGEDGIDGEDGEDGRDGIDGKDGKDGKDGQIIYVNGTYGQVTETPNPSIESDDVILITGKPSAGNVNPSTGVAAGIILPAAAVSSVLLVKKNKRRRGRK